ncbi:MAG: MFS transporter [Thermomicrobiales bacterium]|nr:MFS transporter [Thermomicrobiales bacterium]
MSAMMAGSTLSYGVMVFMATLGASQLQISTANATAYLAALIFGLQGGMVADSAPKRTILAIGFSVQALLCLLVPLFLSTNFGPMLMLIFFASAIAQVVSPGLKAIVAIVATPDEVATTGALVAVVGSIGSAIGASFVAPLLINLSGINAVLAAAAVLYLLGAVRILKLPDHHTERGKGTFAAIAGVDWKPRALSLRYNAEWIVAHPAIASMLLVGILCTALFEGLNSLLPVYVRDVLNANPANAIYIFAPAGIGFLLGALGGPRLIYWFGERTLLFVSLGFMVAGAALLGVIKLVAPVLAVISPLRLLEPFGIELSDLILAAGVVTLPANFGSTAAGQAVQVYINRRVPAAEQGGIFGLEQVQQNAFNLVAVFLLGVVATFTGPAYIFLVAPLIVASVVLLLVRYSLSRAGNEVRTGDATSFLFDRRDEEDMVDTPGNGANRES